MLLVKDGFLVDPVSGRNGVFDILIEDGHVAEVDTCIEVKDSYEVIDAKGKYIMPGFVDLHEHFREPGYTYKETVKTALWQPQEVDLLLYFVCLIRSP